MNACVTTIHHTYISKANKSMRPFTENFSEFISVRHIIGIAMFVWASWQQHRCHVILARMRKDKTGMQLVIVCEVD